MKTGGLCQREKIVIEWAIRRADIDRWINMITDWKIGK